MNIAEILSGFGGGGLVGGILGLGNTWLSAKIRKDERPHELAMLKFQIENVARSEDLKALAASFETESKGETFRWVEAVRKLTRPVLTFGLVAVAYFARVETLGPAFLELAGLAVGWWFAARPTLGRK
jgi:hypothetical protein